MLQRITLKVAVKKEKDRSKAMKIAVGVKGVISVKIGGDDNNTMTVIGNEVDAVNLSRSLVKKLGSTTLVRVEPVVKVYRYSQDQLAPTMIYEGLPAANNYNNAANNYNNFTQPPMNFYNSPLPQYQPRYYYPYERPAGDDSGCSIM